MDEQPGEAGDEQPGPGPGPAAPLDPLVATACAKAALVWVSAAGRRPRPLWHVWHDGAVVVVVGGSEQPDPLGAQVTSVLVQVPSKDNRALLVSVLATVEAVRPGDERWEASVFSLAAHRLNVSTAVDQPAVWAQHSRVLRLVPTRLVAAPGSQDEASGAVAVPASPATTVDWRPYHLRGRRRRRFRL